MRPVKSCPTATGSLNWTDAYCCTSFTATYIQYFKISKQKETPVLYCCLSIPMGAPFHNSSILLTAFPCNIVNGKTMILEASLCCYVIFKATPFCFAVISCSTFYFLQYLLFQVHHSGSFYFLFHYFLIHHPYLKWRLNCFKAEFKFIILLPALLLLYLNGSLRCIAGRVLTSSLV